MRLHRPGRRLGKGAATNANVTLSQYRGSIMLGGTDGGGDVKVVDWWAAIYLSE